MDIKVLEAAHDIDLKREKLNDHIRDMKKVIWHSLKFNNGSNHIKDPELYMSLVKVIDDYYTPSLESLKSELEKL